MANQLGSQASSTLLNLRNFSLLVGLAAAAVATLFSHGWNRGVIIVAGVALLVNHFTKRS